MIRAVLDSIYRDVAAVCGHVNAQHALLVRLTETVVREGVWVDTGCRSVSHWLAWQAGVSPSTARKIVTVAERAETHPALMAAFDAGELSLDQVSIAIRAPAYTDRELCCLATQLTVGQLSYVVRKYPFEPEPGYTPNGTPAEADPAVESSASMWVDDTGIGQLQATLTADDFRVVDAAMREARDALFQTGRADVDWGDALVEIANRSLDTVTDAARRDRFRVHMYINGVDRDDPAVLFADNWRAPDALRDLFLCDAAVVPVYTIDGVPVSVGRAQYIVPDRTRRVVEHRDHGCRVPGCSQRRWVQVHHIVHYGPPDNGPTDTWNLICLCPHHHRLHHRGKLGITGNADLNPGTPGAVVFTDARGRCIEPGATPVAPGGPLPEPTGTWQHPLGERLQHWAVYFNPPRPTHADTN
ncbi:MAG: HNH endonuclease [Actinomycetota bacterium]|nr:HNH endonuclease [Actinomycetota bacterium]